MIKDKRNYVGHIEMFTYICTKIKILTGFMSVLSLRSPKRVESLFNNFQESLNSK